MSKHPWLDIAITKAEGADDPDDDCFWRPGFVSLCLARAGFSWTHRNCARAYIIYGERVEVPVPGTIVVFTNTGWTRVGFLKHYRLGKLTLIGGTRQGVGVIHGFDEALTLAYRWPNEPLTPDWKTT